jgi:hypothetical protein
MQDGERDLCLLVRVKRHSLLGRVGVLIATAQYHRVRQDGAQLTLAARLFSHLRALSCSTTHNLRA